MYDPEVSSVMVAWGSFLAVPVLALILYWKVRRQPVRKALAWGSAVWLGLVIAGKLIGLTFALPAGNVGAVCLAYGAYCFLAFSSVRLRVKLLRYLTLSLAVVPIILGYAIGTVGGLAVVFILGNELTLHQPTERMPDSLICRTQYWGAAFTDEGYDIGLYRQFAGLELLVVKRRVDESAMEPTVTCADLAALRK